MGRRSLPEFLKKWCPTCPSKFPGSVIRFETEFESVLILKTETRMRGSLHFVNQTSDSFGPIFSNFFFPSMSKKICQQEESVHEREVACDRLALGFVVHLRVKRILRRGFADLKRSISSKFFQMGVIAQSKRLGSMSPVWKLLTN